MDDSFVLIPPFYATGGLDTSVGRNVFVNQNCTFYDLGGLRIADDVMIGPNVNLIGDGLDSEQRLRNERAKLRRNIRRWQQACDKDDSEPGELKVAIEEAERKLAALPGRLQRLRKSGLKKQSRTDQDARFLRSRGGFELGYTGEIAMSEDHLIVAQRVSQQPTDNA